MISDACAPYLFIRTHALSQKRVVMGLRRHAQRVQSLPLVQAVTTGRQAGRPAGRQAGRQSVSPECSHHGVQIAGV